MLFYRFLLWHWKAGQGGEHEGVPILQDIENWTATLKKLSHLHAARLLRMLSTESASNITQRTELLSSNEAVRFVILNVR